MSGIEVRKEGVYFYDINFAQARETIIKEDFKLSIKNQPGQEYPQVNSLGYTNLIMDNIMAEGKTKPFIIVMTFGMTNKVRMGGKRNFKIESFHTLLLKKLIPYVDAKLRQLQINLIVLWVVFL